MSGARVIGLGQRYGGDDAVGLAVIAQLRAGDADGLELCEAGEPAQLYELVLHDAPIVIVDAFMGAAAGQVRVLEIDQIDRARVVSSHGLGVADAIALAGIVAPARMAPRISIVGVAIERVHAGETGLSPSVAAAVPRAAEAVLRLLRRDPRP